ncbi:type II toxin-antitoxin system RelB family antitoxin [Enterococcus sp. DIV1304_2]|uniref:type II toxin-antitoxin system RelB family antitoxin n=1 Tax=unclassified Enterococcus TaxID=2608891 RepID=UPI003D2FF0C0
MSEVTIHVSEKEKALMLAMADLNGLTISELARTMILGTLERQIDLAIYNEAMKDHQKFDESVSHDEMKKELGLC